jgi:hypothetical protein
VPSPVDKYFKSVKEKNPTYSDQQAWATAWSIYCKHKNPGSPSCHMPTEEYLKKKEAAGPLREFEDVLIAGRVASRFRSAAEDDDEASSKDEKRGEFNLYIRKSRATRWDFSLHNPEGGSSGRTSFPSVKAAIAAAIGRGLKDTRGKEKVWVIIQEWDPDKEDYVTKKTYWEPIPKAQ